MISPTTTLDDETSDALADPLALYTPGGPRPDLFIDAAALDQALAHFTATYWY
jgi:hypothetical protein